MLNNQKNEMKSEGQAYRYHSILDLQTNTANFHYESTPI